MNDIKYALLDPTGNITVLVESTIPVEEQPSVAKMIMEKEPEAEQAGFISACKGGTAIRMAGGEFCGNAAMSAAVLFALDNGITDGTVPVYFCGQHDPVNVKVSAMPDGAVRGAVDMPRPISVKEELFPDGESRPVVRFNGITHVISEKPIPREEAEKLAPVWCSYLDSESLGIMTLDRKACALTPLVYVPAAGTMFWENSCASGTTAVGAYLYAEKGPVSLSLRQPGGALHVRALADGGLVLSGTVRLLCRKALRSTS